MGPGFAALARPLLNLLKKNVPYVFTEECRESFEALKRFLCESPMLRLYPDFWRVTHFTSTPTRADEHWERRRIRSLRMVLTL